MAYTKTNWGAGQRITADLMNKIEQELYNLDSQSTSQAASINSNTNNIDSLETEVTTARGGQASLGVRLSSIDATLNSAVLNNSNYVEKTTYNGQVSTINEALTSLNSDVSTVKTEILAAHRDTNDTLDERFDDLEAAIASDTSGLNTRITALETSVGDA